MGAWLLSLEPSDWMSGLLWSYHFLECPITEHCQPFTWGYTSHCPPGSPGHSLHCSFPVALVLGAVSNQHKPWGNKIRQLKSFADKFFFFQPETSFNVRKHGNLSISLSGDSKGERHQGNTEINIPQISTTLMCTEQTQGGDARLWLFGTIQGVTVGSFYQFRIFQSVILPKISNTENANSILSPGKGSYIKSALSVVSIITACDHHRRWDSLFIK